MFHALFIAFCLSHQPCAKHEVSHCSVKQVETMQQPDLIKWNLQYFHDAMQRDDRSDMEAFAKRSIELMKQHKSYAGWLKIHDKDEYFKLMNLKKVIPPPLKAETPKEVKTSKKMPSQIPAPQSRRYIIPGEQIPKRRDNLPGNR